MTTPVPAPVSTNPLAVYRKAVNSFIGTVIAALLVVLPAGGGFGDLTLLQWLGVVAAVVGVPTVVALTTNATPAPTPPEVVG